LTPGIQATYALVVLSALMHAYWNYLIKRAGGTTIFVGLSKISEVVVYAPVFAIVIAMNAGTPRAPISEVAVLVTVGAALTLANYVALAQGYSRGDLSVIYPLSRGAGLLFLPAFGYLVFGERLSATGWTAVGMILVALVVTSRPSASTERAVSRAAVLFALLAGLAAAGYTVWDKRAIQRMPTFLYFYAYTVLVAIAYAVFLRARFSREELEAEWRRHRRPIVLVGILNTAAYLLILVALKSGTSTYVIALRQLSIAFGVGLGVWRLGESLPSRKAAGLILLICGCALVAFAR
jgi:drug/metabolite transporter (DMT)-like permease